MKTDRLTLLISPADKAAINARASSLGISVSELVRKAALDYDPEMGTEQQKLEALLSELEAALDRIDTNIDAMQTEAEIHRIEMQRMASPEYREQVRQDILADQSINWANFGALFGALRQPQAKAA